MTLFSFKHEHTEDVYLVKQVKDFPILPSKQTQSTRIYERSSLSTKTGHPMRVYFRTYIKKHPFTIKHAS